ncbi:DUF6436 domain-containing protein [Catalinimonas niigatensis]|uniref:DUF6436 domain-containing protein n=1 Tax=Catalinimonas niigatensis TaxID=1397264 RepID=UPI002665A2CD|nr:deiodinase-like protein [Catalinimonas niigatensis]WPP48275.1 redoxin domain-containing protein [Catalinimonas niigatensis]
MKNAAIRIGASTLLLTVIVVTIIYIFWKEQAVYLLPTPKPGNYHEVALGAKPTLHINQLHVGKSERPLFLHFYNPDCPCSRFNLSQFKAMVKQYQDSVDFYVILHQSDKDQSAVESEFEVPVIRDDAGKIADAYGVYATPQALILNGSGEIYYRGNYNKARYCTSRETRFAELALDALIEGKPLPQFVELASISYGCSLPSDKKLTSFFF